MFNSTKLKYIYLIVNAYLIYIILQTAMIPVSAQFINLQANASLFPLIGILVISTLAQLALIRYKSIDVLEVLFLSLMTSLLTGLSLAYSILSIQFGYLLILLALTAYFYQRKEPYYGVSLIGMGAVLLRLIYLLWQGESHPFEIFQWVNHDTWIAIIFFALVSLLLLFLREKIKLTSTIIWLGLGIILTAVLLYLSMVVISRPLTFASPNYDMGIFTQVFESMRQGRGPMTSLERDILQSHFNVHVSPILYALLPIYALFPNPSFLNFLQVLVVASGLIPLYLIVRHLQLSRTLQGVILFIYGMMPTLIASQFYDFHENCFLAPLLLWLFYTHLKQAKIWNLMTVLLTLMVKEDAFIYVVALGLFFLFQSRFDHFDWKYLIATHILLPILYFFGAVYYLSNFGSGAMVSRFSNFMVGDQGLLQILVNGISNPLYTLHTIFIPRKINYMLLVFACLGFIPLLQKSWSHYFLLLPMLVINLLSNYVYQVDISKQYHFGSTVLAIIMLILALEGWYKISAKLATYLLFLAISMSVFVSGLRLAGRYYHIENLIKDYTHHREVHQVLDKLPRDQQVLAYTFYTPHLADIEYLYDIYYHDEGQVDLDIDYIVFPEGLFSPARQEGQILARYQEAGYIESDLSQASVKVWERQNNGNHH